MWNMVFFIAVLRTVIAGVELVSCVTPAVGWNALSQTLAGVALFARRA
jgi:hypothetical protein